MFKTFLFFIGLIFIACYTYSQTLFIYGKHAVSKDEFLRAYNKNPTSDNTSSEKALREYLNLYINFKLKVQAAKDIRMDTLPSLKGDVRNFRSQIEENYLKDEKEVEALINEAAGRSRTDIHALHFFAPVNSKMLPVDTVNMLKAINKVYAELMKGDADYDEIVSEIKKEIAPITGSDLGFITAFTLPYEFENLIYNLKPGEISKPYRSKKGWHVFKNVEQRPAAGKVQVAQILLTYPPENNILRNNAKKLADSIYRALQSDADFSTLAKALSDDRVSNMNGGVLPEFGIGKYDGAFESAAFKLKNDGDISEPFETGFGFHILRRISRKGIAEVTGDESAFAMLRQQVFEDKRIQTAEKKYLKQVLAKTGFQKNTSINEQQLWKISDSFLISNKKNLSGSITPQTTVFSFNNAKVSVQDWLNFLQNNNNISQGESSRNYPELMEQFIYAAAKENYRERLETFSPEFRQQLDDFKEGNMLFEIMNNKVWSKASDDSAGLKTYYDSHRERYKWEESAAAILFSCTNAEIANQAIEKLQHGTNWREVAEQNANQIQADSGRFEISQLPVVDRTSFSAGLITAPVTNPGDGTTVFSQIIELFPAGQQRSFENAKGIVINDYQGVLEQGWIEQLKKRYPVTINEKVFSTLL
jgi:peptidyl-prolyl cis-trans isomerase SurA